MPTQNKRTTTVWGLGSYPMGMIPPFIQACRALGITERILAVGVAEYNRATFHSFTDGRDGIVDISPPVTEIKNAAGFVGDRAIAELNRPNWESSSHGLVDRLLALHHQVDLADGESFWFQSFSSGHTRIAEESLHDVKERHPRHFVTTVSTVPEEANLREGIREDPAIFVRYKDAGLVETTILPDALSPLARRFGLAHQDACLAMALATILAAQIHFPRQRGFADIVHGLGRYSAFTGVAVSSRNIVVGREVRGWKTLRRSFGLPQRGFASLENVLIACQQAAQDTLSDPLTQLIEESIDARKLAILALTVPLKLADTRWTALAATIKDELTRSHPNITVVFAAGNGVPDPRYQSPYWVQASLFYPLPELPSVIQGILNAEPMLRRSTTTPATSNGHRPADDHSLSTLPITNEIGD